MTKILIIAGCSKKKLPEPAPASELNHGQLFKAQEFEEYFKKLTSYFNNLFDDNKFEENNVVVNL